MHYKKRGFFTSKKGMDIDLWFNVFELVVVFLVGLILLDTVNGEIKSTTFEKIYFARDSALLVNTIYSSPGDVQYNYPEKTGNFIFDFKQNKVEVYEQNEIKEGGVIGYPFAEDKTSTFYYTKLLPRNSQENNISYSKNKKNINVNN